MVTRRGTPDRARNWPNSVIDISSSDKPSDIFSVEIKCLEGQCWWIPEHFQLRHVRPYRGDPRGVELLRRLPVTIGSIVRLSHNLHRNDAGSIDGHDRYVIIGK